MRCAECGAGDRFLEIVEEHVECYCRDCGTYQEYVEALGASEPEPAPLSDPDDVASLLAAAEHAAWGEPLDADAADREAQASGFSYGRAPFGLIAARGRACA